MKKILAYTIILLPVLIGVAFVCTALVIAFLENLTLSLAVMGFLILIVLFMWAINYLEENNTGGNQ